MQQFIQDNMTKSSEEGGVNNDEQDGEIGDIEIDREHDEQEIMNLMDF